MPKTEERRRRDKNPLRTLSYTQARQILIEGEDDIAEILKQNTVISAPRQLDLFDRIFGRRKDE